MLVGVGTVFPSSAQAVSCAGQPDGDADFAANNKVPGVAVYGTAATVQA